MGEIQAPARKYLLLISGRAEDRALCEAISTTIGTDLKILTQQGEAVALLTDANLTGLFMDAPPAVKFQAFESSYRSLRDSGKTPLHPNLIHFLTSDSLDGVGYIIRSDLFSNCIQRTGFDPLEAGNVYGRLLRIEADQNGPIISRILDAGAEMLHISPVISTEKAKCIEQVDEYLTARGFPGRIANRIATATDELLMNAIFDAPVDDEGKLLYSQTARSAEIKLEGKHTIELMIGFDGKYAAVSVVDHFGSLQKHLLTDKIARTYQNANYKVSDTSAGAGLGVFTVFHSGVSLIYSTMPRIKTESVIAFRKTDSMREFKEQFHFLSLLSKNRS